MVFWLIVIAVIGGVCVLARRTRSNKVVGLRGVGGVAQVGGVSDDNNTMIAAATHQPDATVSRPTATSGSKRPWDAIDVAMLVVLVIAPLVAALIIH